MRALLIINPVSGDAEPNAHKVSAIQTYLARGPFVTDVAYTSPERTSGQIAREAVAKGVPIVIVGGGDGTVSEVARELIHSQSTLGILPIGTFNNIARSLGILPELPEACAVITHGEPREVDVGLANEEHYFFEAAGAGLDATLFPIGEEIKGGRWTRILQAARLTLEYRAQRFDIELDCPLGEAIPAERRKRLPASMLEQRRFSRRALFVVGANGPYYGGGFTVAAGARVNDGKLTLSIYGRFSKWELIRHFRSISRGRHHYSPKIETYTAKEIRIASRRSIPVHVDGQPFGCTPVTLRAVHGALRVFALQRKKETEPDAPVALPSEADPSGEKALHHA
ncbi:MAG TPA: diacylglycerol kinase family protein [Chthoniobacteraceae bacterium]